MKGELLDVGVYFRYTLPRFGIANLSLMVVAPIAAQALDETYNTGVMVALQQNLLAAAKMLRDHLFSNPDTDVTWSILLESYRHALDNWKKHYALSGSVFLNPNDIRASLDASVDEGALLNVVSAANLVILMDTLCALDNSQDIAEITTLLQVLDNNFPWCIIAPHSARMDSYQEYGTFPRALDIRTQRWIYEIITQQSLDGTTALDIGGSVFLASSGGEPRKLDISELNRVELEPIFDYISSNPEMDDERLAREEITERLVEIWPYVQDDGFDIGTLQAKFPVQEFFKDLAEWAENLYQCVIETIEKVPTQERQSEETVTSAVEHQIQRETEGRQDAEVR